MRCRADRIQQKFITAIRPPARTPSAIFDEKKAKAAIVRMARNPMLPLMMTAKRLSSFIAAIISVNLLASDYIDVFEAGGDAYKQKNIKEPGFSAKPAIQSQSKPNTDADGHDNRYAHAGYHGKAAKQIFFVRAHADSFVYMDTKPVFHTIVSSGVSNEIRFVMR